MIKSGRIKILNDALKATGNPELINDNPNTAPSKRIIRAIEGEKVKPFFHYNKPKTGKFITAKVGIEVLREKCPHFNKWIEGILNF